MSHFPNLIVTVDGAVTVEGRDLVLIRRAKPPCEDRLVLPGGHVEETDATLVAACPCERGCPSCTGPRLETGGDGKALAARLLEALPAAHLLQSAAWGEFKSRYGWIPERWAWDDPGGEPVAGIMLDAAYYRHGRGYPGALACRLDNEGPGLVGVGLITDCYAYYLLAVRHIAEASPEALPKVISDLRAGVPVRISIPARLGVTWSAFEEAVEKRARRTFTRMSPLSSPRSTSAAPL